MVCQMVALFNPPHALVDYCAGFPCFFDGWVDTGASL